MAQTLLRRDEHAFRLPRLDALGHSAHQGPLRHPVQEGNVVKDLHSVLELACERHAHHLAL